MVAMVKVVVKEGEAREKEGVIRERER